MIWVEWAIVFLVAVLATLLLVPVVSKLAVRVDAVDYPSARRVNKKPIPRLGGVAMVGGMAIALVVYIVGVYALGWHNDFLKFRNEWNVNMVGVAIALRLSLPLAWLTISLSSRQSPSFWARLWRHASWLARAFCFRAFTTHCLAVVTSSWVC